MRVRTVLTGLALALVVAACGGSSDTPVDAVEVEDFTPLSILDRANNVAEHIKEFDL